ncbi:hypothetical protein C2845_PM05G18300 [Panicum miliaceum]|uniref:Uncharacterized protein n=1 Tax=Panicum miliaceum TaxID=4540 RepID=A0A3L6SX43_PANMI|nr:hypothetical protein C2845_PM05G18300 [Panicum miliaceum]
MVEARAHVEKIQRERFYIGREERNPLAEDIHQAISYLSEELDSKDVHFLMELIQIRKIVQQKVLGEHEKNVCKNRIINNLIY